MISTQIANLFRSVTLGRARIGLLLATVLAVGAITVGARRTLERARVNRAIQSLRDWSKGTDEQRQAIAELDQSNDPSVTDALVMTLTDPKTRPDVRELVSSALSKRDEPQVSVALSEALQPHNALGLRVTAVSALQGHRCSGLCARNLLHYLERLWWGELPNELLVMQTPSSLERFKREESQIESGVEQILLANRIATLTQLRGIYGLGSMYPSRFSLHMVELLRLTEACNDVKRPYLREVSDQDTRKAIDSAMEKIPCTPSKYAESDRP